MRKGLLLGALFAAFLVMAGTSAVVIAGSSSDVEPAPGPKAGNAKALSASMEKFKRVEQVPVPKHFAQARAIRRLARAHNNLVAAHNALVNCLRVAPVTRYSGYAVSGGGSTTALDFTNTGDPINVIMLHTVC
jgi:hypothetical protein